jgi:hypothetical protein
MPLVDTQCSVALSRGLAFLLSRQSPSGFWADWQLPPGESRIWTTAYVGYRLSALSGSDKETTSAVMRKAADWLLGQEFPDGGWGYVEEVGADADSTALAILFLTSHGFSIEERSWERLRAFQRPDGGFATFTPQGSFGSWVESHADVTATAVLALLKRTPSGGPVTDSDVARGLRYLRRQVTPSGLWNSFWWNSCLYATEANLLLSRRASAGAALASIAPKNCFERALLILSLLNAGSSADTPEVSQAVSALISRQLKDGSWPSAPILRLTDRDCLEPWTRSEAGPLFADKNRIFTTATAVAALAAQSHPGGTRMRLEIQFLR